MNLWDILLIAVIVTAFSRAVARIIGNRKRGGGCGGNCAGCSGCSRP